MVGGLFGGDCLICGRVDSVIDIGGVVRRLVYGDYVTGWKCFRGWVSCVATSTKMSASEFEWIERF